MLYEYGIYLTVRKFVLKVNRSLLNCDSVKDEAEKLKLVCKPQENLDRETNDSEEELMPVKLTPAASSTPYRTLSICTEIQNSLVKKHNSFRTGAS